MESAKGELVKSMNLFFGEKGWSLSICNCTLDFVEEGKNGLFSAGAMAIVRIQLTNGIFREDIGYGACTVQSKSEAISRARKEAVFAAMKGSYANFRGDCINLQTAVISNFPQADEAQGSLNSVLKACPNTKSAAITVIPPSSSVVKVNMVNKPCTSPQTGAITDKQTLSSVLKPSPNSRKLCDESSSTVVAQTFPSAAPTSPLAVPLPTVIAVPTPSEEEQAKAERIRRSRLKQEEFRQKHLLQQAQAQSKALGNQPQVQNGQTQQLKSKPLSMTRSPSLRLKTIKDRKDDALNNGHLLDVDDDPLLSTQDMDAVVQCAVNNNTRKVCSVSQSSKDGPAKRVRL